MAIEVSWYYEDQVILAQPSEEITLEEILSFSLTMQAMLDESEAERVHLLLDQTHLRHVPQSFREIRAFSQLFQHRKFGQLLIFGEVVPLVKFVSTIATYAIGARRFQTLEEALAFLVTVDPTLQLPDLLRL